MGRGSRSWSGFRRSAILLRVIQSFRTQGRSALDLFRRSLCLRLKSRSHELSLITQIEELG
ncbi:MAG: hypothetical protein AB4080_26815 [Trichodesmium sp.]